MEINIQLLECLEMCLNYIEHSEANRGKLTNDNEWDYNVLQFRENGPSRIGIGRCYTAKAFVDFDKVREVIKQANKRRTA